MHTIAIDLETYSPINLATSGVYRYAEDPEFRILLFGYSIDGEPAHVIDLAQGETIPADLLNALSDPTVTKSAFNAAFELVCLSFYLRRHYPEILAEGFLDPRGWRCTMVWAASLGLPMSLDGAAKALCLTVEKDPTSKRLIRQFSIPRNDGRRMMLSDDLAAWKQYVTYNCRDVDVEVQLASRLARNPMPQAEWETYWLDQRMNDIDTQLATNAVQMDAHHRNDCLKQSRTITGLENPNSPLQLKEWLNAHGCHLESLTKTEVEEALETAMGDVSCVLRLRQDLSKSSVKKYQAMLAVAGSDHWARGLIQYMGAGRTGRFAGRLVQVQNLPRNMMPDLARARAVLHEGDREVFELLYSPISDTLSQLIRTAFIPSEGHRFIVADFSAIEARVLAWLAGEEGTLEAFREGKDIYCQTASRMFGVPVEKHGANSELRQKGKIAVLACGYGGSVRALKAMGALRMGLDEAELKPLVDAWREANAMIVQFWHNVEQAAITTIQTRTPNTVGRITILAECTKLLKTKPRLTFEPRQFNALVDYATVKEASIIYHFRSGHSIEIAL